MYIGKTSIFIGVVGATLYLIFALFARTLSENATFIDEFRFFVTKAAFETTRRDGG